MTQGRAAFGNAVGRVLVLPAPMSPAPAARYFLPTEEVAVVTALSHSSRDLQNGAYRTQETPGRREVGCQQSMVKVGGGALFPVEF